MSGNRSTPLRLLVVAGHEPWPLDHGGRLRLFNFVRCLARRAAVTLALPRPPEHADRFPQNIRIVSMHAGPGTPRNSTLAARIVDRHFGAVPAVKNWLRRNARPHRFDVALFSGAATGRYIDDARIPVVWDAVDDPVLSTLRQTEHASVRDWLAAARAAAFQVFFTRYVARRAAATVLASRVDASFARRWVAPARVEVVSNGVDLEYFSATVDPPKPGTVLFFGALDFPPNVDGIVHFTRNIWPAIHANDNERRLLIVGRRPVHAVQQLASIRGVQLIGSVPDVRKWIGQAAVVVVPTRGGGGVKNKVLEACAMSRPVIAAPRALAGLSARIGRDVRCARNRAAWIREVSTLLEHPDAARTLARAGFEWVRSAHRWPALAERLHNILRSAGSNMNQHVNSRTRLQEEAVAGHRARRKTRRTNRAANTIGADVVGSMREPAFQSVLDGPGRYQGSEKARCP